MKLKNLLAISMSAVLAMTALTACGSKDDSSEAASESASSSKKTAKVIEIDLTDEQYAFGVDKDQPELLTQVNDFIKSMNEDGSLRRSAITISVTASQLPLSRQHSMQTRISL